MQDHHPRSLSAPAPCQQGWPTVRPAVPAQPVSPPDPTRPATPPTRPAEIPLAPPVPVWPQPATPPAPVQPPPPAQPFPALDTAAPQAVCPLTAAVLQNYRAHLLSQERSAATIDKYLHDTGCFIAWLGGRPLEKEAAAAWKAHLLAQGYAPASVNSMLAALHSLLGFLGRADCRVRFVRVQRRLFRDSARDLERAEYQQLLAAAAQRGQTRLALLMEAICATGIRVGELRYITVEAARAGKAEISLKGKVRTILLPGKLCRKLQKYAQKEKITTGEIFLTGGGKGITRRQVWAQMKALCKAAGVAPSKVFPHNLRHLFAKVFYRACHDIVKLADVLGHASIETTRIYLLASGEEHARQLERLGLVQ